MAFTTPTPENVNGEFEQKKVVEMRLEHNLHIHMKLNEGGLARESRMDFEKTLTACLTYVIRESVLLKYLRTLHSAPLARALVCETLPRSLER